MSSPSLIPADRDANEHRLDTALRALRASEIKFRGLADLIPEQVWTATPDGQLDYVNERVCSYFGRDEDAILGSGWLAVLHPDDVEPTAAVWGRALETGESYEIEFRLRRADGAYRPHIGRAFPLLDDDGAIVRWFGTNTDVADERELRRLAAIVDSSDDAIIGASPDGMITDWNPGAERLYGYRRDEVLGSRVSRLAPPRRQMEVASILERVTGGGLVESLDTRRVTRSGREIDVSLNASPIRDETGQVVGAATIERDITDRKRMERELAHHALHDALTGLPNRALFMDRLSHALKRRHRGGGSVAVLFVDLDNFKLINDSLGHSAGDALLALVPARLSSLVRRGDTVARFGGDEFVILCEMLDGAEQGAALAQRILSAFDRPFDLPGARHFVTTSVGIAFASEDSDPETLVSNADTAMYRAKEEGRARYEVFDQSVRARLVRRLEMEARLRRALTADELYPHYQPIVRLGDARIISFEALMRWHTADGQPVSPSEFIPVAEQSGLIIALGDIVLRRACEQAVAWGRQRPDVGISVNVSPRQLADPGFAARIGDVLGATRLEAGRLCLEITESSLMEQESRARETLEALRALGVQVALDDFGTGYSSLSYLKHFALDVLKIDRSFVAELGVDGPETAIVDAIMRVARTLGLRVVAEGVETGEQAALLRGLGCDEAQGFLFSRPLPADGATELLRRSAGDPAP